LALVFMQQNRKPETADEVIEEVAAADSADNDAEDKTVIVIPGMTDGAAAPAAAESPVAEAKPEKKPEASEEKVSEVKRPATEVIVKKRPPVKTSDSTLVTFTVMDLSRPEYLRKAVGLLEWREANLSDGKQFLEKVDQMWSELCYPETEKERALFKKIMIIFSGMDEQYRCIASRENLRQEHSKLVAQDVAKDAEQKAADRQRESERQKLQQEIDRQTRENQLLLQKNEQAMRKRADSLKGEVDLLLIDCVMAMRNSAISGDNKVLEQALKRANDFIANQKVFSPADAKTIREFKALLPQLTKEQKQMREYFKRMLSINEKLNLRILFAYGTELLCGITPGELKYRAGKEVKVLKYDQALPRTRKTLFEVLGKRGKIAHAEFYSDIFHGKRPQDKVVPKGLWKTIWPVVKKSFK